MSKTRLMKPEWLQMKHKPDPCVLDSPCRRQVNSVLGFSNRKCQCFKAFTKKQVIWRWDLESSLQKHECKSRSSQCLNHRRWTLSRKHSWVWICLIADLLSSFLQGTAKHSWMVSATLVWKQIEMDANFDSLLSLTTAFTKKW